MKKGTTLGILTLALALLAGGCKQSDETGNLVTIDLTASHPKKELILQDFMDVEYIPLQSSDEFVTQGDVLAIGSKYIVVKNWINDGDIFLFDRTTGKGIRKINRLGQGAEEYTNINGIVLDEDNNEMLVNCGQAKKICVYDLEGNFKRSFTHTEGTEYLYIANYDKDHLMCYDISLYYKDGESRGDRTYHAIVSKQDGSISRSIEIPFDVIKAPVVRDGEGIVVTSVCPIIPYKDDWMLVEISTDTVYKYVPSENQLIPFIVKIPTQNPETLLTMGVVTDRYYFMQTVKKTFDFSKGRGFYNAVLVYDNQEKALFDINVLNADYVKKQSVDMTTHPINGKIASFQTLPANRLVEAYENDGLKGKLKEVAATLNDESNPVLMLLINK